MSNPGQLSQIPNLSISLDVTGGADTDDAIRDAVALANKLGIFVAIAPNGIKLLIKPGDDPDDVAAEWESKLSIEFP